MTVDGERFRLKANDGFELAAVRWVPKAPRGIVQLSHGMSEYAERYAPFALACKAAGLAVYAHDHRGHGESVDAATPRGFYAAKDGFRKVVGDLETVRAHAASKHPGLPLFLFGHSMGSFITRARLLQRPTEYAGVVISATGFRGGLLNHAFYWTARREAWAKGPSTPSRLMSVLVFGTFNLRFLPARTHFDWLSRNPAEVDAYMKDRLCGFDCSGQLWADLFAELIAIEKAEDTPSQVPTNIPLLLIAGTHDPVSMGGVGHEQLATRYRAAGATDVIERRYPEGRHELLNEYNREYVHADILDWIDARIGGTP